MPAPTASPTSITRILRNVTIGAFLPAFILLLIHGIISGQPFTALGLIPLAGSAFLSAYLLYRDRLTAGGSAITLTRLHVLLADALLAVILFIFLIFSWITLGNTWRGSGQVVLGTYGTVPMMLVCGIEAFLALKGLKVLLDIQRECPHCKNPLHGHRHGYLAVDGDEEEVESLRAMEGGGAGKEKGTISDDDLSVV